MHRQPSFGFDSSSPPALDGDFFTFNIGAGSFGRAGAFSGGSGSIGLSSPGIVGGVGALAMEDAGTAPPKKRESFSKKLEKRSSFFDLKSKRDWRQKTEDHAETMRGLAQSFR